MGNYQTAKRFGPAPHERYFIKVKIIKSKKFDDNMICYFCKKDTNKGRVLFLHKYNCLAFVCHNCIKENNIVEQTSPIFSQTEIDNHVKKRSLV